MGASLGQPRCHPGGCGLDQSSGRGAGRAAPGDARCTHRDDQGARNPGLPGLGEQFQPRRPRSRATGTCRLDGGGDRDARRNAGPDRRCVVPRVHRRLGAQNLSPRAQYGASQVVGGGRRDQSRGASGATGPQGRDRLSERPVRTDVGVLRRGLRGQEVRISAPLWQLCHGKRAVQDLLPRGVPRPDGGRGGGGAAPGSRGAVSTRSNGSFSPRTNPQSASSARPANSTTRRTGITACNT